jgi:hypothetical protein
VLVGASEGREAAMTPDLNSRPWKPVGPPRGVSQQDWDAVPLERRATVSRARAAQYVVKRDGKMVAGPYYALELAQQYAEAVGGVVVPL